MDDDKIYAIHKAVHTALLVCVLGIMFGMVLSVLVHVYAGQACTPITRIIQNDGGACK